MVVSESQSHVDGVSELEGHLLAACCLAVVCEEKNHVVVVCEPGNHLLIVCEEGNQVVAVLSWRVLWWFSVNRGPFDSCL